jgi:hypothetical protein
MKKGDYTNYTTHCYGWFLFGRWSDRSASLTARKRHLKMTRMQQSFSERLADIVLRDAEGRLVRLGSLWSDGPAVIAFLRHYG